VEEASGSSVSGVLVWSGEVVGSDDVLRSVVVVSDGSGKKSEGRSVVTDVSYLSVSRSVVVDDTVSFPVGVPLGVSVTYTVTSTVVVQITVLAVGQSTSAGSLTTLLTGFV
jgi:hypothetical protein